MTDKEKETEGKTLKISMSELKIDIPPEFDPLRTITNQVGKGVSRVGKSIENLADRGIKALGNGAKGTLNRALFGTEEEETEEKK